MISSYEKNKDLPQIKALSEFQLKKYKKLMDEIDGLKPQIKKAQNILNELHKREGLCYRKMEQMWIYNRRNK